MTRGGNLVGRALGILLFGAWLTHGALAALPPQYQRQNEILAAINGAVDVLGDPIDAVEMIGTDLFRVTAGRCHVDVRIVDTPVKRDPPVVGPREFGIEVGPLDCN